MDGLGWKRSFTSLQQSKRKELIVDRHEIRIRLRRLDVQNEKEKFLLGSIEIVTASN
jgi:hypothetical protein